MPAERSSGVVGVGGGGGGGGGGRAAREERGLSEEGKRRCGGGEQKQDDEDEYDAAVDGALDVGHLQRRARRVLHELRLRSRVEDQSVHKGGVAQRRAAQQHHVGLERYSDLGVGAVGRD